MNKCKIAHDIACGFLPAMYSQYIANGGNPNEYDIISDYKLLFSELIHDERLEEIATIVE